MGKEYQIFILLSRRKYRKPPYLNQGFYLYIRFHSLAYLINNGLVVA
ncbi:MAG: hypothetical protein AB1397_06515 [bacterium]